MQGSNLKLCKGNVKIHQEEILIVQCVKCGYPVVKAGEEAHFHHDGKGTYLSCPSCQAKNYIETDSEDSGSNNSH